MRKKRALDEGYRERESARSRNKRIQYVAEGRCIRCSKKLDPDCDAGKKQCLNCRERSYEYAKI